MINRKIKKQILAIALSSVFLFTSSNSLVSSLAEDSAGKDTVGLEASTENGQEQNQKTGITDNDIEGTVDTAEVTRFHFENSKATIDLNNYKTDSEGNGYLMIDVRKDFIKGYSNKLFTKDDEAMTISTSNSGDNKTVIENNFSSYTGYNSDYIRFYIPYQSNNKKEMTVTFEIPNEVQKN